MRDFLAEYFSGEKPLTKIKKRAPAALVQSRNRSYD